MCKRRHWNVLLKTAKCNQCTFLEFVVTANMSYCFGNADFREHFWEYDLILKPLDSSFNNKSNNNINTMYIDRQTHAVSDAGDTNMLPDIFLFKDACIFILYIYIFQEHFCLYLRHYFPL